MNHMTNIRFIAVVLAILSVHTLAGGAWPTSDSSSTLSLIAADDDSVLILADPLPARLGIAPYFGQQPTTLRLGKRECLANGTNFCFNDSPTKSCPDCGGCCSLDNEEWCCASEGATCCPGRACCQASETCCGDGCCPRGSTCKSGKCEVPVVTVTSTKTAHSTRTQTEAEVVTVQVNVIDTSTVNSIITTTVTSEQGTHTEITYVTSTIVVKRSLPTSTPEHHIYRHLDPDVRGEPPDDEARAFSRFQKRFAPGGPLPRQGPNEVELEPRQRINADGQGLRPRQNDGGGTSTSTVVITTTIIGVTTVTDSRTTTRFVTSTITTTIFQSSTRVVGARETVSVVSVILITSHAPTTNTITSTSTTLVDPTGGALPPATSSPPDTTAAPGSADSDPSPGLSTPAMVGIGVGTGLSALILAVIALLFLRARRRRKADEAFAPDYVPAPRPAPIPLQNGDTFFGAKATSASPGHSRALSSATTQVSSGRGSPEPGRGAPPPDRTQRRSIPHPSTSTVGRMARFAELEGTGPGGMG
ncbi:uncharacterized protein DNG_00479 [Cephalotrichum gorgonifer]|uniref:Stig1 domain-containing protein n=1 Tax=Cephalotrichum gorgonifer TaxID=2041049 RepID=A0AAE8MNX2_9PEZI|nr:uncharacterized protein DNG_00479 [Cephalotrichum gorgonifer]